MASKTTEPTYTEVVSTHNEVTLTRRATSQQAEARIKDLQAEAGWYEEGVASRSTIVTHHANGRINVRVFELGHEDEGAILESWFIPDTFFYDN